MYCTYVNLGLLFLFLCNLGSIHGHFIRFCGSLFIRCCFLHKAKQGGWPCVQSQLTNLSRINEPRTDSPWKRQILKARSVSYLFSSSYRRVDDSAIPHIKIKITEIPLEKKVNVPLLSCWIGARFIDAGEIYEFSETAHSHLPCFALCRKTTPKKQRAAKPYKMAMNWAQIHTEKATTGPSLRKYNLFLYLRFNNYFEFLIQSL